MKELVERTGGLVVQTDSFTNPIFKESLKKLFDGHSISLSSNAMLEVTTFARRVSAIGVGT